MADRDPSVPPHVPRAHASARGRRLISLVWVVPMVAALVAGWLAVQALLRQGPTITISFVTAEGLEPGISKLKYKDVEIGTVSALTLSSERSHVIVTARMQKQAQPLLNADTKFWVVRPRVSASSVSGLGTLFSGAYIGVDAGSSTEARREFVGLEVPPVVLSGRPGTPFLLKSENLGSLDIGSPVYFRQVQVGQVIAFEIDADGRGTTIRIFVNAPYDRFVKARSRFWVASGIDASFDAGGFRLDTESLVSMLVGGISFRTPPDAFGDPPVTGTERFDLFPNRAAAMRRPDTVVQPAVMIFRESVRGLAVGAPIDFRGIQVGEVRAIGFAPALKNARSAIRVQADLYPDRLRSDAPEAPTEHAIIEGMVRRGLRAQLRQGNLLTGQLYIALDFLPGNAATAIAPLKGPLQIPTAGSAFTELQFTVANIAKKLERLPLDDLARDVRGTLRTVNATLTEVQALLANVREDMAPELRRGLTELRETLAGAREVLSSDAPVQSELRATLQEVARSAEALRVLAETLERQPEAVLRGKAADR